MPAEVRDRVHALARRANANKGLKFTDSDGNDLDAHDDSDYDPDNDDDASDASSEDSDFDPADNDTHPDANDDNYNPELPDPNPAELAGVKQHNNNPVETT
jgi:hypothetical protein